MPTIMCKVENRLHFLRYAHIYNPTYAGTYIVFLFLFCFVFLVRKQRNICCFSALKRMQFAYLSKVNATHIFAVT